MANCSSIYLQVAQKVLWDGGVVGPEQRPRDGTIRVTISPNQSNLHDAGQRTHPNEWMKWGHLHPASSSYDLTQIEIRAIISQVAYLTLQNHGTGTASQAAIQDATRAEPRFLGSFDEETTRQS